MTSFLWLWAVSLCAWHMGQLLPVGLCDMNTGRCVLCHEKSVTIIPLPLSAFLSKGRYLGPILLPCKGRHLALCNIFYNGMTISRFGSAVDTAASHLAMLVTGSRKLRLREWHSCRTKLCHYKNLVQIFLHQYHQHSTTRKSCGDGGVATREDLTSWHHVVTNPHVGGLRLILTSLFMLQGQA